MPLYRVYIDKAYFPRADQPTDRIEASVISQVLRADSRGGAAAKFWARHGADILRRVRPEVKIISLHVSGENAINGRSRNRCLASRMSPIRIWKRS